MVRAPEAESPKGVKTPEDIFGEGSRKASQARLLALNAQIVTPGFDPEAMLFNSSSVTYDARVERSMFFSAGMPYQLVDVLRGVKIFDFNREEERKPVDLIVERTPTSLRISSDWENASIFLHMAGADQFVVQLRPFNSAKPYRNQELADATKDVLRQSKRTVTIGEGRTMRTYQNYQREFDAGMHDEEGNMIVQKYDRYDKDNIARDEHEATTILMALQIMAESGSLRYRSSSDNKFRRMAPDFPSRSPLEERQLNLDLI